MNEQQQPRVQEKSMVRELGDSALLLGLAASSLGAYVGIAFAVVKVFAR
jgi:hypothetical protein